METQRIAPEHGQQHMRTSRLPGTLPTGRLYMTGDLRALTGLPRTHMDFYLREGIIQPTTRTGSGYLLFDHGELETLRAVLRWRAEGVGIREIRDRLGRPASH
jgi:DNA-binding transcriptional MerR regulator